MKSTAPLSRRSLICAAAGLLATPALHAEPQAFRLRYVLATPMYGHADLRTILPEVKKTGTDLLDIWPKPHGNHREQLEAMGEDAFRALLDAHGIKLAVISRYDLGPFKFTDEIALLARFGGQALVCGSGGPKGLSGAELKGAVAAFVEKLKPHAATAAERGIVLAIENHRNSLIEHPDALRWFCDAAPVGSGLAFGPHHLEQDAALQAGLIAACGPRLVFFYAQQWGKGSHQAMPKEDELLQMPGRGPLDFAALVAALKKASYGGLTEIYMHPFPRGKPILDTIGKITAEIQRARDLLDEFAAAAP